VLGFNTSLNAFYFNMLVLPNGHVLLSNYSGQILNYALRNDDTPDRSWAPAVREIQQTGSNRFTLTGTQLNGISEGASYGDDNEMSTNYPIVRLTNPSTGRVFYARTSDWSSTGVATGSKPVSVDFTLPAGVDPGVYYLSAIANGIASRPVLTVLGGEADDTVEVGTYSFP